jgi:hypothetical protein
MPDYIGEILMRSGDQLPLFAVAIESDDGVPLDISTATSVDIVLINQDGFDARRWPVHPIVPLALPGHIVDGPSGLVTYDWGLDDILRPGIVDITVVVNFPTGTVTAPSDRAARITVRPDVNDVQHIFRGGSVPGRYDLYLYRGDSYGWDFRLWEDDIRTVPLDLTAATSQVEIRNSPGGAFVVPLASTITLPNIVHVSVSSGDSAQVPASGVWDLQITFSGGETLTPLSGVVAVTPDVTTNGGG